MSCRIPRRSTALLTVGEADLVPRLFAEVVIPEAVHGELLHNHVTLPAWLRIGTVSNAREARRLGEIVDPGEAEAIELARELRADRLLIDERKGRRLALQEGVPVIGLVGVLLRAKQRKLIPVVGTLLDRLQNEAGVYLSQQIRNQALQSVGE